MKKLFIAAICSAVMIFSGCISDCDQCCIDREPNMQAPSYSAGNSSFGDEQYIWESWQYGTNRVDMKK